MGLKDSISLDDLLDNKLKTKISDPVPYEVIPFKAPMYYG